MFDFKIKYKDVIKIKHLKKLMKKLRKISKDNKSRICFMANKIKLNQKSIETSNLIYPDLKCIIIIFLKWGTRNSYSKNRQ